MDGDPPLAVGSGFGIASFCVRLVLVACKHRGILLVASRSPAHRRSALFLAKSSGNLVGGVDCRGDFRDCIFIVSYPHPINEAYRGPPVGIFGGQTRQVDKVSRAQLQAVFRYFESRIRRTTGESSPRVEARDSRPATAARLGRSAPMRRTARRTARGMATSPGPTYRCGTVSAEAA